MCCDDDTESLPAPIADMLDNYRRRLQERGYDWGGDYEGITRLLWQYADKCDPRQWQTALEDAAATTVVDDPVGTLLRALATPLPAGVAVARPDGVVVPEVLPWVIPGHDLAYRVFVIGADGGDSIQEASVSASNPHLTVRGHRVVAAEPAAAGRILVRSDAVSRWSIVDDRGGAWFPVGALRKFDSDGVPYFYGNHCHVDVPAGHLTVTVSRGSEFRPATRTIVIAGGADELVQLRPERLYDAAARGWYGADLHVHLNYTGDAVCTLDDAALAQRGEGLHLVNLVAANQATSLVYDREVLDHYAGRDLPHAGADRVIRAGVEFRNDLFGHFHALAPAAAPRQFNAGHIRSDDPYHWPPNATVAKELRDLGATIAYAHPVFAPPTVDGSLAAVFDEHRAHHAPEARELVADAALGLVDSMDLMMGNIRGTEHLYHRLLNCGIPLAATAGTDVMLSHTRGRFQSDPPGWARVYAGLGTETLSAAAFQRAIRSGRTFVTTGPWIEIDVAGAGPGDTVELAGPTIVRVEASAVGDGIEELQIIGPDGPYAGLTTTTDHTGIRTAGTLPIAEPTWIAAVARGGARSTFVGVQPRAYAHTSPVWIRYDGEAIARPADAWWCLDWLDRLEKLARSHGRYDGPEQLLDLIEVLDRARVFYRGITEREAASEAARASKPASALR